MDALNKAQSDFVPCIGWLRRYQKDWLRPDVMAGLTAAAVVIPKAMAYATIAGLSVQVGLYTVFLPMLIYAALGTSRPLSVSTTTTSAILTGVLLGQVTPGGDPASLLRALATLAAKVNHSTPWPKGRGLFEVHPFDFAQGRL
jgi:MFS superfamily sulfate permease-like transporter